MAQLDSRQKRALEIIGHGPDDGITKSELARTLFGELTGSTQSLVTRLTQRLGEFVDETKDGRRVLMRLNPRGRDALESTQILQLPSWAKVKADLGELMKADDPKEHASQRPLAYLHIAAMLAGERLISKVNPTDGDLEFARALQALVDERADPARGKKAGIDRELIAQLARSWPCADVDRLGLFEAIVRVQDSDDDRTGLAADLLRLGSRITPGQPEGMLWLALAVPEAARIGLSWEADGTGTGDVAIRNALFELSRRHSGAADTDARARALAHYYRGHQARALARIDEAGKSWTRGLQALQTAPATATVSQLLHSTGFNVVLSKCDAQEWSRATRTLLERWPEARRYVFEEAQVSVADSVDWALRKRSRLREEWSRAVRPLADTLRDSYEKISGAFDNVPFKRTHADHKLRADFVLGSMDSSCDTSTQMALAKTSTGYISDVLHNGWSTPMLWGHIAASTV